MNTTRKAFLVATFGLVLLLKIPMIVAGVALLAGCGGGGKSANNNIGGGNPPPVDFVITGEVGRAVVGPGGGTVMGANGNVKIEVPAGALAGDTTIVIQAVALDSRTTYPGTVPGTLYMFAPAVTFTKPATVIIEYDPGRLPAGSLESKLTLYQVSARSGSQYDHRLIEDAVNNPQVTVDTSAKTVSAKILGFPWIPPGITPQPYTSTAFQVYAKNQFAGVYDGSTRADSGAPVKSGNLHVQVNHTGSVYWDVTTPQGSYSCTGQMDFNGRVSGDNSTMNFSGTFRQEGELVGSGPYWIRPDSGGFWGVEFRRSL